MEMMAIIITDFITIIVMDYNSTKDEVEVETIVGVDIINELHIIVVFNIIVEVVDWIIEVEVNIIVEVNMIVNWIVEANNTTVLIIARFYLLFDHASTEACYQSWL